MGFGLPLDKWFSGKLNSYAKDVLLSKKSKVKDFFDESYIKEMIESNNRTEDFGPRLWSLMSLELWLKAYFD